MQRFDHTGTEPKTKNYMLIENLHLGYEKGLNVAERNGGPVSVINGRSVFFWIDTWHVLTLAFLCLLMYTCDVNLKLWDMLHSHMH